MSSGPPRRFDAASFRCRRRKFDARLTVCLTVLTALLLFTYHRTAHFGYDDHYAESCTDTMDDLLLMQMHWESAPSASRWITGFRDHGMFYSEFKLLADAARRDGYLTDSVRLRMVFAAMLSGQREATRAWEKETSDSAARAWCRELRDSSDPRQTLMEFQERLADGDPEDSRSTDVRKAAADAYHSTWRTNAIILAVLAAGLPGLLPLMYLLFRRGYAPGPAGLELKQLWTPERVWGAWLRAEWLFLFSGIGLLALSGLASWSYEATVPTGFKSAAEAYDDLLYSISSSVWGNLFYTVLWVGPVFMMVRWLTPGFHSILRLFGIRRCPLNEKQMLSIELPALVLVGLLYLAFGLFEGYFGFYDPRDAWSRTDDSLWEEILYGCILAPFVEEFIFRGFLFTAFRSRWGSYRAAWYSSLLFALVHGYSFTGTLQITCFGLLMCVLYHRTGTLRVPMRVHFMTNALLTL